MPHNKQYMITTSRHTKYRNLLHLWHTKL